MKKAEDDAAFNLKEKKDNAIVDENVSNNNTVKELMTQLTDMDNSFLEQGYTKDRNPGNSSAGGTEERSPRGDNTTPSSLLARAKAAESQVQSLKKQLAAVIAATSNNNSASTQGDGNVPSNKAAASKISSTAPTSNTGADPAEVRRLNRKIKELEAQLKSAQTSGSGSGGGVDSKALQAAEKQLQKKLKDQENSYKRETKALEMRATKAENSLQKIQGTFDSVKSERDQLKSENEKLFKLTSEISSLKAKADRCDELDAVIVAKDQELGLLSEQFKKETNLRKKYKNELEDLKGAIRVFARCRPMARYELEKGCKQVVEIKDETSMKLYTSRGEKEFEFDAVFSTTSTQDQVFEDTKRLVESCLDGFNVCVFAYGQTGSGMFHLNNYLFIF